MTRDASPSNHLILSNKPPQRKPKEKVSGRVGENKFFSLELNVEILPLTLAKQSKANKSI